MSLPNKEIAVNHLTVNTGKLYYKITYYDEYISIALH